MQLAHPEQLESSNSGSGKVVLREFSLNIAEESEDEKIKKYFEYDMSNKYRGMALIFNQEFFKYKKRRSGTKFDRDRLKVTFDALGFNVKIFEDSTTEKIEEELEKASKMDHSESDCIAIVILSHGDLGSFATSNGIFIIEKMFSYFYTENSPTLKGKPRLFFIQACRGDNVDQGFKLSKKNSPKKGKSGEKSFGSVIDHVSDDETLEEDDDEESIPFDNDSDVPAAHEPPNHQDFLIVRSTVPGYVSYRNPSKGSWFIQHLCDELDKNAIESDLLSVVTQVNFKVSERESVGNCKQTMCISNMLIKILKFNNKTEGEDLKKNRLKKPFQTLFHSNEQIVQRAQPHDTNGEKM